MLLAEMLCREHGVPVIGLRASYQPRLYVPREMVGKVIILPASTTYPLSSVVIHSTKPTELALGLSGNSPMIASMYGQYVIEVLRDVRYEVVNWSSGTWDFGIILGRGANIIAAGKALRFPCMREESRRGIYESMKGHFSFNPIGRSVTLNPEDVEFGYVVYKWPSRCKREARRGRLLYHRVIDLPIIVRPLPM